VLECIQLPVKRRTDRTLRADEERDEKKVALAPLEMVSNEAGEGPGAEQRDPIAVLPRDGMDRDAGALRHGSRDHPQIVMRRGLQRSVVDEGNNHANTISGRCCATFLP
jgi:hypothetical protein